MLRTEAEPYRRTLRGVEAELEARLRNRASIEIQREPDVIDDLRLALERDLAIQGLERDAALLREVRLALDRIEAEEYGICVQCGQAIGSKRLAALPWAEKCVRCQETADTRRNGRRPESNGMPDAA